MTDTTDPFADTGDLCDSMHRIIDLHTLEKWRSDLTERLARAQLKFNHVNCLSGEFDELADELEEFRAAAWAFRRVK